jgi:5-deoxy-glucuronate isomerase
MSKLLVRSHAPDAQGSILEVTPQSAGWTHVGFQVVKLAAGETFDGGDPARETCVVVMSGTAEVTAGGVSFGKIGGRTSVFEDGLPAPSTSRPPRPTP